MSHQKVNATNRLGGRAQMAVFLAFGLNGFALASWMARVPDVKETLALSPGELGILLLGISMGSIAGLPIAGKLAEHFGLAPTMRGAVIAMLPGLFLAAVAVEVLESVPLVIAALVITGFGSGVWDVCQNLSAAEVEHAQGRPIMSWFHAAFSAATVLGALVGSAMIWLGVPILVHLGGVVILAALVAIWTTKNLLPSSREEIEKELEQTSPPPKTGTAWLEPRTLAIGLMVLAAAFTEGTANDWMAVAFVDGHQTSNALGVLALAVFLAFMTAGRLFGAYLLNRFGRVSVLICLYIAAIFGSLLVIFGNTTLAFIGAAVWGLGASLGFPVGISAAADDPRRAPARVSVVTTIGYLALLAGPPLLGFLGDHVGILHALLMVTVVSSLAMLVVPASKPLPPSRGQSS